MITSITIDKVATYRNATTLTTDKKVNIIYGLNGTGKSTLSRLLQNSNSPEFANCRFTRPSDTRILVYNQKFLNETFFESDEIKGVFSLSKENKEIETTISEKKRKIDDITSESNKIDEIIKNIKEEKRQKNDQAITKTWEIKQKYAIEDRTLRDFLKSRMQNRQELYNFVHDWKKPEKEPSKSIEKIKTEYINLTKSNNEKKSLIQKISFNVTDIERDEIFSTPIMGSKSSSVSGLISKLNNSDWVREGLNYIDESTEETQACPFCQESTLKKALVDEIYGYFDKTYDQATKKLKQFKDTYSNALERILPYASEVPDEIIEEHWQEIKAGIDQLIATAELNINIISEKQKSPSETKTIKDTSNIVSTINEKINKANDIISEHNRKLDNKVDEIRKLKDEFWDLMRWNYDQTICRLDQDLLDCESRTSEQVRLQTQKQTEKLSLESDIRNLQSRTVNIEKAISSINQNLLLLGITDFSIKKHSDDLYRIERSGNQKTNIRTLSEGEKTIITFLYFVEMCKGRSSPNEVATKKIAVIDDPISSLSHLYVFNIGELIKSEFFNNDDFDQVFVLTHSLYFFYELTDINKDRRDKNQKLHRISKNSNGSVISDMTYQEIQNDYQSYWSIVNNPDQNEALIANCMRNIIEYFFSFVEKKELSNVFQIDALKGPRFQAFNRYINRESHSLGQNIFDYKEFNYNDFLEGLRLVFHETGYGAHFEKMRKKVPS